MFSCQYCGRECSKFGLVNHERYCKSNPEKSEFIPPEGWRSEWSPERRERHSVKMKEVSKTSIKYDQSLYWTPENRLAHSIKMKEAVKNYPESYSSNNVCGRVKLKEYKGTKLNGGWELLVAQYLDENNISWTNKVNPIEYKWNDSIHSYFPDFYLPEMDLYIEVKGYERDRDLDKWSEINNLIVIKQKEITQIQKGEFDIKHIAG